MRNTDSKWVPRSNGKEDHSYFRVLYPFTLPLRTRHHILLIHFEYVLHSEGRLPPPLFFLMVLSSNIPQCFSKRVSLSRIRLSASQRMVCDQYPMVVYSYQHLFCTQVCYLIFCNIMHDPMFVAQILWGLSESTAG